MKSNSKQLLKNTAIYTIGNLGSKLLSFLLVPLYSFYLSKSALGYFDLIITSVSLLSPFVTLQISDASYRWLIDPKSNLLKKKQAITNGTFIILFNSAVFLIIYVVAAFFTDIKYGGYLYAILLITSLYGFLTQNIRSLGNSKLYSLIGVLNTILVVVFNLLFIFLSSMKVETLLASIIVSNTLSASIVFFKTRFQQYIDYKLISKAFMKEMLHYSWPLVPNAVSWWLINEVNRFIILYAMGASANGVFAISNRFPSIITILNSIFMMSWQDMALANGSDETKTAFYTKLFNIYIALELTMVIGLTSISKPMVQFLIGASFQESWKFMPILYLSVAFSAFAAFLGVGYLGSKKTYGIFSTTIIGSGINIIISALLIKKIGLYAPTLGTLLGFVVIYLMRVNKKVGFDIKVNYKQFITLLVICLVFIGLTTINDIYVQVGSVIGASIIFIVFNKPLINHFTTLIRKAVPFLRPVNK